MAKSRVSKTLIESDPIFLIVDLFCGFGGTTTGFTQAEILSNKIAKVIACVNHDPKAIKSHWLNHEEVTHFEEDIRTLDLTELVKIVAFWRNKYPSAYLILWASLECTNFSKAKGGQPRSADSRTLADHLPRYQKAINPDFIKIENVVEFKSWGPLDENGKPLSKEKGLDYTRWKEDMCSLGYYDDWKELNSANFGAYTSRNRLFGCFAKHGLPIVWPQVTHAKKPSNSLFLNLHKWMPVKEVLNFSDEGESIFNRKKELSDKTLERIYAGLVKYVAKGDTAFISKYFSGRPAGKVTSIDSPCGVIKTVDTHSLIQPFLLQTYAANSKGHNTFPVDSPARTVTTRDSTQIVLPVTSEQTNAQNQSLEQPAGSILPNDKHRLVQCDSFIMPTNFDNQPTSLENPLTTITANRKYHYIVNPSHGGHTTSTDAPCPVIIARQDKAPLYLVQAENGTVAIAVFDSDSEVTVKIKQFMSVYGLVDIKMRMLRVPELLKIQGFPDNYQMVGTQSDHKKFIGNSVVPIVPKVWAEAMGKKLLESLKTKAA